MKFLITAGGSPPLPCLEERHRSPAAAAMVYAPSIARSVFLFRAQQHEAHVIRISRSFEKNESSQLFSPVSERKALIPRYTFFALGTTSGGTCVFTDRWRLCVWGRWVRLPGWFTCGEAS